MKLVTPEIARKEARGMRILLLNALGHSRLRVFKASCASFALLLAAGILNALAFIVVGLGDFPVGAPFALSALVCFTPSRVAEAQLALAGAVDVFYFLIS